MTPQHILEIRYGPGPSVSDFDREVIYQDLLLGLQSEDVCITCSTSNLFDRVRVGIRRGELESGKVRFRYEHMALVPDKDGRLDNWPDGFLDQIEKDLLELF